MSVSIRLAYLKLVNVDSMGTVYDKDDNTTTLDSIKRSATKEFRVIANGLGAVESPNATNYPTIEDYLESEASDGFQLTHIDQNIIITQSISSISSGSGSGTGFVPHFDPNGNNVAQPIKTSAGVLYNLNIYNSNGADAFVQLFDAALGDVTVGTTTPDYVIYVPAGGGVITDFNSIGMEFNTAITYTCTTTATGAGAPAVGLTVSGGYV